MAKRRSINDDIHGDRAVIRSARQFGDDNARDFHEFLDKRDDLDVDRYFSGGSSYKTTSSKYSDAGWVGHSCYHQHPPLAVPGTDKFIYGGSCLNPVVKDADVLIGFDGGMEVSKRSYPWNGGHEVLFRIPDGNVPADVGEFKKLVAWTLEQLDAGKKVHCGCIGGHGRTGTFLAALCAVRGEKDAIAYVRKNYCDKAVENSKQVKFLVDHFDVTPVVGEQRKDWATTVKPTPIKGGLKNVKAKLDAAVTLLHHDAESIMSIWR